jgi:hypothetical protein
LGEASVRHAPGNKIAGLPMRCPLKGDCLERFDQVFSVRGSRF